MKTRHIESPTPAQSRRSTIEIVSLCLGAFAFNSFSLPLHYGVDFLFGSVFVLLAAWRYGPWVSALVAAVGGIYPIFLWNHAYATLIFISEAIVVGFLARRFKLSLILLDGIYWVFCGIPLVWVLYHGPLNFEPSQAYLIVVKDAVNGLLNALLASLILPLFNLRSIARSRFVARRPDHKAPLAHTLFNILVGCVLVPTILFTVVNGRQARARLERTMDTELETTSKLLSNVMLRWHGTRLNALRSIVRRVEDESSVSSAAKWQNDLALVSRSIPDFIGIYAADTRGKSFAFFPERSPAGKVNLGTTFADRGYYKEIARTKNIVTSGTIGGARGLSTTIAVVAVPFFQNRRWQGFVCGALDLNYASRMLDSSLPSGNVTTTVVDRQNHVLATTRKDLKVGALYDRRAPVGVKVYQWSPSGQNMAPVKQWQNSVRVRRTPLNNGMPWTLYVEAPYANPQRDLQNVYAFNLTTALALIFAALLVATVLGTALARPLHTLARLTTDLPGQLTQHKETEKKQWPRSSVREIDYLVRNFRTMEHSLNRTLRASDTARAELEAERTRLDEANRLKDDFLAVLSHELRTPLVPVLGYADLISRGILKGDDATDAARAVERNARAQLRLIEDLLDVSAIMSGKIRLQMGVVNLPIVLRESGETMRIRAHDSDIGMFFDIDETTPYFWGDAARLRQVVWNLLSNSLKFTPAGGSVNIVLRHTETHVLLVVKDTGMGINPDFLPHVFDRFRQAGDHLTRPAGGLGLGLAIVQHFVEMHDGTITADSAGEDKGATFTVTLPIRPVPTDLQ
ncbi:MAG TPA: ATP-binding protein [Abditibacteriaceae bacterium]